MQESSAGHEHVTICKVTWLTYLCTTRTFELMFWTDLVYHAAICPPKSTASWISLSKHQWWLWLKWGAGGERHTVTVHAMTTVNVPCQCTMSMPWLWSMYLTFRGWWNGHSMHVSMHKLCVFWTDTVINWATDISPDRRSLTYRLPRLYLLINFSLRI